MGMFNKRQLDDLAKDVERTMKRITSWRDIQLPNREYHPGIFDTSYEARKMQSGSRSAEVNAKFAACLPPPETFDALCLPQESIDSVLRYWISPVCDSLGLPKKSGPWGDLPICDSACVPLSREALEKRLRDAFNNADFCVPIAMPIKHAGNLWVGFAEEGAVPVSVDDSDEGIDRTPPLLWRGHPLIYKPTLGG